MISQLFLKSLIIGYKLQPLVVRLLMALLVLEDARTKLIDSCTKLILSFTSLSFSCHSVATNLQLELFDRCALFVVLLPKVLDLLVLVLYLFIQALDMLANFLVSSCPVFKLRYVLG